jgi:hypothetical protein
MTKITISITHMRSLFSFSVTAKLLLLLSLSTTVLIGCSSTSLNEPVGTITTAPQGITKTDLNNEVLVFGRIRWIENGEERTDYKNAYGWNIWPKYFHIENKKDGTLGVAEDGYFAWQLPKGTYIAYHLKWFDSWDGWHRLPLRLAFQAPETQKAYCVGTIIVKLRTKRDFIGGLWIKDWDLELDDSCEQNRQWFQERYVNLNIPVDKSLLIYDPNIPEDIHELERKEGVADFMRAIYPLFMPVEMK